MTVSTASIIGMIFTLVISIGMPIALVVYFHKKTGETTLTALVGAGVFMLFAMILEPMLHSVVIPQIRNNIPLFIAYVVLAAGIFEETGRFAAFYLLRKKEKENGIQTAFMYGVGHGGIECIAIVAFSCFSTLSLSLILNQGGSEALLTGLTGDQLAIAKGQLETLTSSPAITFFIPGIERIIAMLLQVSLSVLVWLGVSGRASLMLYPVAVALHAVCNLPAAFYQAGILKDVYLVEGITALMAGGVTLLVYYIYKSTEAKKERELEARIGED